jgi:hypothetical protein
MDFISAIIVFLILRAKKGLYSSFENQKRLYRRDKQWQIYSLYMEFHIVV